MKKLLSLFLAMFMILTILPSEFSLVQTVLAADGPIAGGDQGESEVEDESKWVSLEQSTDGIWRTSVWDDPDRDYAYVKTTAKERSSNYYYTTVGWTFHSRESDNFNPAERGRSMYVPLEKPRGVGAPNMKGPGLAFGGELTIPNHAPNGDNASYTTTINGIPTVVMINRIDKRYALHEFDAMGDPIVSNSSDSSRKTFYISAASAVHKSSGWDSNIYTSLDSFATGAGDALWSIVKDTYKYYFNVPLSINYKVNHVKTMYDFNTGERLGYELIGESAHKGDAIPSEVSLDSKITVGDKSYKLVGSTATTHTGRPDNDKVKSYTESIQYAVKNKIGIDEFISRCFDDQERLGPRGVLRNGYRTDDCLNGIAYGKSTKKAWYKEDDVSATWEIIRDVISASSGTHTVGFYVLEDVNMLGYDNKTGKTILEDSSKTGSYKFPETVATNNGNIYELIQTSSRKDTTVEQDKSDTFKDVQSGKTVMDKVKDINISKEPTVSVGPTDIGRAEYEKVAGTTVLYYNSNSGELLKREETSKSTAYTVSAVVDYNGKNYKAKQISYRLAADVEADISSTRTPVMSTKDIGLVEGNKITLADSDVDLAHIIRVECVVDEGKDIVVDGGQYTIPSQHLTKNFQFQFPENFSSYVDDDGLPKPYEHTYRCGGCYCNGHGSNPTTYCSGCRCDGHTCNVGIQIDWGTNVFDWNDTATSFLPDSLVFANRGVLSKADPNFHGGANSFVVTVKGNLPFTSHRQATDKAIPLFAKYMSKENSSAISWLKGNAMTSTITESLVGRDYNSEGGSEVAPVAIYAGDHTNPHGRPYVITTTHSGCGAEVPVKKGIKSPSDYTSQTYQGLVVSEPVLKSKTLPVSEKVKNSEGTPASGKMTFYSSPTDGLKFYPTFKMYADGKDAWMLGAVQRTLVPINVYEVEILNTSTPVKVESTWSRDSVDTGRMVMKGGYSYGVSTAQPLQVKVTSYIVSPKADFVENGTTVRSNQLKLHSNLVETLKQTSNMKIFTNLPESYRDDYPAEWKIGNSFKQSGDSVAKSRIANLNNPRASVGNTSSTITTLEQLDSKFSGKINNAARLKAQLDSFGWYDEKFAGFEVVKQETIISYALDRTVQTNFIRNGGKNYNDLAKSVHTIPANKFGVVLGMYNPTINIGGNPYNLQIVSKPYTFDVRGTAYDDRN